jgi:hypothetical protein
MDGVGKGRVMESKGKRKASRPFPFFLPVFLPDFDAAALQLQQFFRGDSEPIGQNA